MVRNFFSKANSGTITVSVVCAVCFILFSFIWLYEFQADVIAVAQHVLSDGLTHYDRTWGAVIVTMVLYALQLLVTMVTKLRRRSHALNYFPSMLLLAIMSDISSTVDRHSSWLVWLWLAPLLLVIWGGCCWLSRQVLPFENEKKQYVGLFSQRMWINLVQMAAMMLGVAWIGNTNAVFHYSAHAELALMAGDTDEALRVGEESLETDERLTMLRVYALSRQGQLADHLFDYPVVGSSETLLPMHVKPQILPADSIWKHLGARPATPMKAEQFYQILERDSLATAAVADYRLCGCLIDRRLDDFVRLLPQYYEVADSLPLPRHYQEALVLYRHQTACPRIVYHNPVIDEDWANMQQLRAEYTLDTERKFHLFDSYQCSYWYYFFP